MACWEAPGMLLPRPSVSSAAWNLPVIFGVSLPVSCGCFMANLASPWAQGRPLASGEETASLVKRCPRVHGTSIPWAVTSARPLQPQMARGSLSA